MRKLFFLIVAVLFVVNIGIAQSNITWHTDFNKAVKIAETERKPLMLFFTGSDWCGWCKKIQKEVFQEKAFETWAKKNVILVEVDFPRKTVLPENIKAQNASLQSQLSVQGYPTIFFVKTLKQNNKTVLSSLGSMFYQPGGPAAFVKSAEEILKKK